MIITILAFIFGAICGYTCSPNLCPRCGSKRTYDAALGMKGCEDCHFVWSIV